MCNKIAYKEKSDAVESAHFIRKSLRLGRNKNRKGNKKLRPYFCKRCDNWHLTSRKPRKYETNKF